MEDLKLTRNRDKDLIERATLVVEEYISKKQLIIYGGVAIDFALRTRGKSIYNDIALKYADYDFYSPEITEDAYRLALDLRARMATDDINIINAVHMRTIKISIEGHFIADITYCPLSVFERIPFMEYKTIADNVVRVVAPHYQAIDIHSALSQPFDNPPMEVINHRIKKDIDRYNMLYSEFFEGADGLKSRTDAPMVFERQLLSVAVKEYQGCMYVGLVSLFFLLRLAKATGYQPRTVFNIKLADGKITMEFQAPAGEYFIEMFIRDSSRKHTITHHRLLDIMPEYALEGSTIVYNADSFLFPAYSLRGSDVILACAQATLKQMMAKYVFIGNLFFLRCYFDLIDAMAHVMEHGDAAAKKPFLCGTIIWPSVKAPNLSMSTLYTLLLHEANIEDRKSGDKEMLRVKSAIKSRPPQLRLSDRNFEQKAQEFLEWTSTKRFFAVDGGRL